MEREGEGQREGESEAERACVTIVVVSLSTCEQQLWLDQGKARAGNVKQVTHALRDRDLT